MERIIKLWPVTILQIIEKLLYYEYSFKVNIIIIIFQLINICLTKTKINLFIEKCI